MDASSELSFNMECDVLNGRRLLDWGRLPANDDDDDMLKESKSHAGVEVLCCTY